MDQIWYWTAVFSCCPLISILGARRPTARIWTGFIIVPLIAVLGWPAVTSLAQFPEITELVIQLPVFIGFVLVLVMGVGNYMGTRYGLSAATSGIAVMISLWPLSNLFGGDASLAEYWRAIAAFLFGAGLLHGFRQAARPILVDSNFDLLWFDFCDSFGIVWSIRIQDRINQVAVKEKWAVRLGTEGFKWKSETSPEEQQRTTQRLDQTLRWLFRRFVENEWIDQRLTRSSAITETESQQTDS